MLIREYHGFSILSSPVSPQQPDEDGDGYTHALVFKDGSVFGGIPTLGEAIAYARQAKSWGYLPSAETAPIPSAVEEFRAQQARLRESPALLVESSVSAAAAPLPTAAGPEIPASIESPVQG